MWTTWTVLNATLATVGAIMTWVVVIGILVTRQRDRRRRGDYRHRVAGVRPGSRRTDSRAAR